MFTFSSRSFIFRIIVTIALFIGTIYLPNVVSAQSVDELKASVDDLTAKIKALDKEIQDFNKKISQTQGDQKTLKAALASLELRRKALVGQIDLTNLKIKQTQDGILLTQNKIGNTVSTIDRNHQALSQIIVRMHTNEKDISPLFDVVSSHTATLSSLFDEIKRSSDVSSQMQLKLHDLKDAKIQLESTKTEYEIQKESLQKLQSSLSSQKTLVDQNTEEKAKLLEETKNKESAYQAMLTQKKKKKGELEAEVLDYESKIRVAVDVSKLPKYGSGVLKYPLDRVTITQFFGNTPFASKNPQVYNGAGHNGVDFGTPVGTSIKAAGAGTVLGTGDTDLACGGVSYGRWVLIRHANGLTTLYAHLSVIGVSGGQSVAAGEQIGLSGNTGYSTGPHLHFTVYASDSVHITSPTEYKSKVCGTYMSLPVAPRAGYLNPLSYL